jgi:hypothetical protein
LKAAMAAASSGRSSPSSLGATLSSLLVPVNPRIYAAPN